MDASTQPKGSARVQGLFGGLLKGGIVGLLAPSPPVRRWVDAPKDEYLGLEPLASWMAMEEKVGPTRTGRWAAARVVSTQARVMTSGIARMTNCYTASQTGAVTVVTGLRRCRLLHEQSQHDPGRGHAHQPRPEHRHMQRPGLDVPDAPADRRQRDRRQPQHGCELQSSDRARGDPQAVHELVVAHLHQHAHYYPPNARLP